MKARTIIFLLSLLQIGFVLPAETTPPLFQDLDETKEIETNIVGGEPAGSYPSYVKANGCCRLCGGVLIDNQFVLSAAHCGGDTEQDGAFAPGVEVCIGGNNIDCTDSKEKRIVDKVRIHPDYNVPFKLNNDIMLIKLSEKSDQPIWKYNADRSSPIEEETVRHIGFGRTVDKGPLSRVLMEVDLKIFNPSDCQNLDGFGDDITICAGDAGKSSCNGDSGGPLFTPDDGKLVGLSSYRYGACAAGPSYFTRVSAYDVSHVIIDGVVRHLFLSIILNTASLLLFLSI